MKCAKCDREVGPHPEEFEGAPICKLCMTEMFFGPLKRTGSTGTHDVYVAEKNPLLTVHYKPFKDEEQP